MCMLFACSESTKKTSEEQQVTSNNTQIDDTKNQLSENHKTSTANTHDGVLSSNKENNTRENQSESSENSAGTINNPDIEINKNTSLLTPVNSPTTSQNLRFTNAERQEAQKQLDDYLKSKAPKRSTTKIDPKYSQAVFGKNGITCVFPKGCFGKNITDSIDIELIEYTKPSDFLLSGLGTMAGDELLESGGTVFIQALVRGQTYQTPKALFDEFCEAQNSKR